MAAKKKPATVLVLRTCNADMTAYGGFKWPRRGKVEAPDWKADDTCGHGLHGLLWGAGDGSLLSWAESAKWLVVEVLASNVRTGKGDLIGKCKFPRGTVRYCGDRHGATEYLNAHGLPPGTCVHGGTATAGIRGTATAGDSGTATAGDMGTATAGIRGTATAGDRGTATTGIRGTATAGDWGTATAGYRGTATAGDSGTATAGDMGTATAGDSGTATAGDGGTATAGDGGTATTGIRGTATAGYRGVLLIRWWDGECFNLAVAIVGQNGIKPNVKYRLNDAHEFEEVV